MSDGVKKQNTFTVTIEYLRDIVAKQTFRDSPAAALRELIQNAHDACLVRAARYGEEGLAVNILLDPVEKTITIEDTGIGMSLSDIHEYLTTVGRGTKTGRAVEKSGSLRNAKRLENVIGEFGFGFIAAFIIADRIEVQTRSAEEGSRTISCTFSSEEVGYETSESAEQGPVGTRLTLHLNRKTASPRLRPSEDKTEGSILSVDTVEAIVRKYCIFLEFPIYVTPKGERNAAPTNRIDAPWTSETRVSEAVQRFYDARIGKGKLGEILHTIPISLSRDQGDPVTLEGILFVERGGLNAAGQEGNLEVFIKRMWVCDHQQALLPAWASFLSGIVITPELRPMPGRDSLDIQHESFDRVRNALHEILTSAFLTLAQTSQRTFNTIMDIHGLRFRWGLAEESTRAKIDRRDFREAELLRFVQFVRYSRKHMSGHSGNINELFNVDPAVPLKFEDRKRIINFVARPVAPDKQYEFRRLLTSGSLEVIVPSDESELAVLTCINEVFDDIILKNVELDLLRNYAGLLEGDKRDPWVPFIVFVRTLTQDHHMAGADVGSLEPDYMPAIVLNVPMGDSQSQNEPEPEPEKEPKAKEVPHIAGLPPEVARFYNQTLVINARNSTMKALLEYKQGLGIENVASDEVLSLCLHECYHTALNAAHDLLPADVMRHHVEVTSRILESYVKSQKGRAEEETAAQKLREELETLRTQDLGKLKQEMELYRSCFGDLDVNSKAISVPEIPQERLGVVVFCDLIGSTGKVVAMDSHERGMVLDKFARVASDEVTRHGGFFDKFTGDGLIALFGIMVEPDENRLFDAGQAVAATADAWRFITSMRAAMNRFNLTPEIQRVVRGMPNARAFELRVAASVGSVFFGRFGGRGTAIGVPMIAASRLCSEKDAYTQAGHTTLVDESFVRHCPTVGFDRVPFKFVPRGLGDDEVPIYKER